MVKIFVNKTYNAQIDLKSVDGIIKYITELTSLVSEDFYLEQNGKRLEQYFKQEFPVYVHLRVVGGKGGFGSMLRAIGAQIEKTTNREACRDLSGRRLRDINEEKRLKAWLERQKEREREAEERKRRKIEKLLTVPKHEFKDEVYEETRSKLTEKVCDAVEEGFKKASTSVKDLKRKNETSSQQDVNAKKKKSALWIDDGLSDDTDDSSDSDSDDSFDVSEEISDKIKKDSDDSNSKDNCVVKYSEDTVPNNVKSPNSDKDSNLNSECVSKSSIAQII